jgi:hypothetical protein
MKKTTIGMRGTISCFAVLGALLATACVGDARDARDDDDDDDESASVEQDLSQGSGAKLWPRVGKNYPVPVCYRTCDLTEETQAECDEARLGVDKAVRAWANSSRITFPGRIQECAPDRSVPLGQVRVNFTKKSLGETGGRFTHRYRDSDGKSHSVNALGYPGTDRSANVSTSSRSGTIRHEFGHALGFQHEYLRDDEPAGTSCTQQGGDLTPEHANGIDLTTDYDHGSIMNRSYCHWDSALSQGDVLGLQTVYGEPFSRALGSTRFGLCIQGNRTLGSCDGVDAWYLQYGRLRLDNSSGSNQWLSDNKGASDNGAAEIATSTSDERTRWDFVDLRIHGRGGSCLTAVVQANGAIMQGNVPRVEPCSSSLDKQQIWRLEEESGGARRFRISLVEPTTGGTGYLILTTQNAVSLTDTRTRRRWISRRPVGRSPMSRAAPSA